MIILPFFELKVDICQLSLSLLGFWEKSNLTLTTRGCHIFQFHLQHFQSPVSIVLVLSDFEHAKILPKFQREVDRISIIFSLVILCFFVPLFHIRILRYFSLPTLSLHFLITLSIFEFQKSLNPRYSSETALSEVIKDIFTARSACASSEYNPGHSPFSSFLMLQCSSPLIVSHLLLSLDLNYLLSLLTFHLYFHFSILSYGTITLP